MPSETTLERSRIIDYLTNVRHRDPLEIALRARGQPPLGAFISEALVPDRELIRTRIYNDWGKSMGMRRLVATGFQLRDISGQPLMVFNVTPWR